MHSLDGNAGRIERDAILPCFLDGLTVLLAPWLR